MNLVLSDDLFDAQLVRALAYTAEGGASLGDCVETGRRIGKTDADRWFDEWTATAGRAEEQARASAAAGQVADARQAFFRASNYHRTAGIFLMGSPVDPRFRTSMRQQTALFRSGASLLHTPPDTVEIPYEKTTLPGYFFRAGQDDAARPTIILTDGYDGTVEELYFASGRAALRRGYNVLAFDGPGQGSVILDQQIPFRPDWENVVRPVVDFAVTLPGVDPNSLVLQGWSFGGYLAPRAATGEHRLAACISDCGPYDLADTTLARIPGPLAHQVPDGNRIALKVLERAMQSAMNKPSAGWALRRNLWVHGVTDPMAYLEMAREYTLKGRETEIECPTFVCATAGDDLSERAHELASKLNCDTTFVRFTAADDVTGHCEMTNRAAFHRAAYDWLDATLSRRPTTSLARQA